MSRGFITSGRPSDARAGTSPVIPREYSINDGEMVRDIAFHMRHPAPLSFRSVVIGPAPVCPAPMPEFAMGVVPGAKKRNASKRGVTN